MIATLVEVNATVRGQPAALPSADDPLSWSGFVQQAWLTWQDGGWAMVAIAAIALILFSVGFRLLLELRRQGTLVLEEDTWRTWIDDPETRHGRLGALLDAALRDCNLERVGTVFSEYQSLEAGSTRRDLRIMRVCVAAAPLVGLLGTVTGMLSTFSALSAGGASEQTMTMIAGGISEALITTETGLVVALPGLFFLHHLQRSDARWRAALAHLESACAQAVHCQLLRRGRERSRERAMALIADRLLQAVS